MKSIIALIGSDPTAWQVQYNLLGWSVTTIAGNASVMITEAMAYKMIGYIRRSWGYTVNKLP